MRDQFLQSVSVAFATWQHIFVFLFAAAVILLFAGDRYNRPTYTRERDGFVALIAPRFLTSDSRYAQGLRIYAAIILGFYVFLVFAGKKVAEALLPSGILKDDPLFFPLAIAMFIIGLSAAEDKGLLGNLEFRVRRFAHERAYIPNGTRLLARRISQDYFGTWQLPARQSVIDEIMNDLAFGNRSTDSVIDKIPEYGVARAELRDSVLPEILKRNVRSRFVSFEELPENIRNHVWDYRRKHDGAAAFRSYYALCRVRMALRQARQYDLIAPDFAVEMNSTFAEAEGRFEKISQTLRSKVESYAKAGNNIPPPGSDLSELLKTLNGEIVTLRSDMAILIAGALMRSRPSDSQLSAVLDQVGLEDEGVPIRRSWMSCVAMIFGALAVISVAYFMLFAVFSGSILKKLDTLLSLALPPGSVQPERTMSDLAGPILENLGFALCGAVVLYTMTALVGYNVRERLLGDGDWRENAFARARATFEVTAVTVPFCVAFNFLVLPSEPGIFWLASTVVNNSAIGIIAGIFFFRHLRSASRWPMRFDALSAARPRSFRSLPSATWSTALLHGAAAMIVLFFITYFTTVAAQVIQLQAALGNVNSTVLALLEEDEKLTPDARKDLPEGYIKLVADARNGVLGSQLKGIAGTAFANLAILSTDAAVQQFGRPLMQAGNICRRILNLYPLLPFSSGVITNKPVSNVISCDQTGLSNIIFGKDAKNWEAPWAMASTAVIASLIELEGNYSYLSLRYGEIKTISRGNAIAAATSGFFLALVFSFVVAIARRYELDDFYSGLSRASAKRLYRRLVAAHWWGPPGEEAEFIAAKQAQEQTGEKPESDSAKQARERRESAVLSARLAEPRAELFEISVQEAIMSEGSFMRLQDQLWLATKIKSNEG